MQGLERNKKTMPVYSSFSFHYRGFPDCQGANISSRDGGYESRPVRYPSLTPPLTTRVGKTSGPEKKKDGAVDVKSQ
jgi:hypothetical protein